MKEKLLEVKDLKTSFYSDVGEIEAVRGISFTLHKGESLGIVGESGSGKSVTALSILGLLQVPGKVKSGEVLFKEEKLLGAKLSRMREIRGNEISMIFQDPMTSLNPLYTIGNQISEVIIEHSNMSSKAAMEKAIEMLKLVDIPSPKTRIHNYPHEFSGGMRQRAMISIALANNPQLLIADEPTTALDVTIQAQILNLLKNISLKLNNSTILITHDLGVVAEVCKTVIVMYGGLIMEKGTVRDIYYNPLHPYTMGLLRSIPKVTSLKSRLIPIPGTPPDLLNPPKGCPFYPRCKYAMNICVNERPPYKTTDEHSAMCWLLHEDSPSFNEYESLKGGVKHE